jgi:hypothetical protein
VDGFSTYKLLFSPWIISSILFLVISSLSITSLGLSVTVSTDDSFNMFR